MDDVRYGLRRSRNSWALCAAMAREVEGDMCNAGLQINVPKCGTIPHHKRRQLGFDVDLAEGLFTVPLERWEALQSKTNAIMSARNGRVQARVISSLVGTIISMHLARGSATQLYTKHMYALINDVTTLNW
jgi:hypothetical protein